VLVHDHDFNATGTYSVHLQRLPAAQRCTGSLTCDTSLTTTIDALADTDLHGFAGVANEKVYLSLGNHGGSFGFTPQWRLVAPDGSAATVCDTLSAGARECTLPAAGDYAVLVHDHDFNATGTYSVHLQRLPAAQRCTSSLTCGIALTTTINALADTDLHGFTGVADEVVQITLVNNGGSFGFTPQWRLVAPDGSAATVCDTLSADTRACTLPAGGAYAVLVHDHDFNATGTYTVTVSGAGCAGPPQATTVTVSAIDPTAIEAGLDPGAFRISRTGSTASALTVSYTVGGTATAGTDYTALPGSAVISAGTLFTDVPVAPLSDNVRDSTETVILTLAAGAGYDIGTPSAATVTITEGPDLSIATLTAPVGANAGQSFNVTVGTRNQGTQATGATHTGIWLSANDVLDAGDTLLAEYLVPALGANITNTVTTAVMIPAGTPMSQRFLIAKADNGNAQVEANEGNNTRALAFKVGPDYIVSILSTVPATIPAGSGFTINDTTKNNGGPVAIETINRFYFSTDQVLNLATDALVAERVVPPLAAGQSSVGSTAATMPAGATPGTRYIIAVTDALGQAAEVSETNNRRVVAVTVP
jgi:hypothetical protein